MYTIVFKSVLSIAQYFVLARMGEGDRTKDEMLALRNSVKPVFMVTILNRWLSKPIKQTLRTNYDSNPLSGIIEMHCVESVPQSRLNNENLFLYNFIVFLSSLNVQRILFTLSFSFVPLGVGEGKGTRYFSRIFEKGCELIKTNK